MRGVFSRKVRLGWIVGLALPLLLAAGAQGVATYTVLHVQTPGSGPAAATVSVTGADGTPVSGVVNFMDGSRLVAQTLLDDSGQTNAGFSLPGGDHELTAVYLGDAAHRPSTSSATELHTEGSGGGGTPGFQLSLSPVAPSALPMVLTAGQSGSTLVTVTPVNNAALTGPMYVSLSCSGLPSLSSCSFTPATVQILPSTPASCPTGSPASACPPTSLMAITTQGKGTKGVGQASIYNPPQGVAWAILLPGILGLGGIAWGARRRRWLQRLALIALVGLVTSLGATSCSTLWYYYQHGPPTTPPTPAGTYTVTVTALSSNGVTAISSSTTMVLQVQ